MEDKEATESYATRKGGKVFEAFNKNVALANAIVQSKEQTATKKLQARSKRLLAIRVYKTTKNVASQIKTLIAALTSKNALNSFVELQEGQAGKLGTNSLRSGNTQFLKSKKL